MMPKSSYVVRFICCVNVLFAQTPWENAQELFCAGGRPCNAEGWLITDAADGRDFSKNFIFLAPHMENSITFLDNCIANPHPIRMQLLTTLWMLRHFFIFSRATKRNTIQHKAARTGALQTERGLNETGSDACHLLLCLLPC